MLDNHLYIAFDTQDSLDGVLNFCSENFYNSVCDTKNHQGLWFFDGIDNEDTIFFVLGKKITNKNDFAVNENVEIVESSLAISGYFNTKKDRWEYSLNFVFPLFDKFEVVTYEYSMIKKIVEYVTLTIDKKGSLLNNLSVIKDKISEDFDCLVV